MSALIDMRVSPDQRKIIRSENFVIKTLESLRCCDHRTNAD